LAGAGLIDLKRRIKSVISTQKITKAMGLVATVKFKTARANLERYKPYFEQLNESVERILSLQGSTNSLYALNNGSTKDLYIVITSDSGLCGSYNVNVINTVVNRIKGRENDSLLITVGQKGKNFFESRGYKTVEAFTGMDVNPEYKDISRVIKHGMDLFLKGKVKDVYMVYTKLYSPAKQSVEVSRILPIVEKVKEELDSNYTLFEPSYNHICEYTLPKYFNALTYDAVLNSIASEYAMRMNSMDSATKNASDILAKLKVMYNRVRQGNITREINEIVSGAEALKE
jgi:F-type H+-transporting ATPase subunit gamma